MACGEYTRFINFSATSAEGTCNRFDPHPRPTDPFVFNTGTNCSCAQALNLEMEAVNLDGLYTLVSNVPCIGYTPPM